MSSGAETAEAIRRRSYFEWTVLAVYIGLTAFVAYHHEPWRDEADPWLYVRDADYLTILARTRYAGFPALWFLLLSPLAKLGAPYWSQKILNLAIASAATALVLWKSNFSRTTRVLIVFSYFLAYEYAVVVRSYALSTFLLFGIAALYERRFSKPVSYAVLIVLLANTSSHGFVISGILGAIYLFEAVRCRAASRAWGAVGLMIAGGVVAFAQLRRPPDAQMSGLIQMFRPVSFVELVGWPFLPGAPLLLALSVGVAVLATATVALWKSKAPLLFFWSCFFCLACIFVFVYVNGVRHYGFVLVALLGALWMARVDACAGRWAAAATVLLQLSLAGSVILGGIAAYRDVRWAYSGSEEAARFLLDHDLENTPIAAHQAPNTAAVLPFLGGRKQFWFAATGEPGSYMKYDRDFDRGLYMNFGQAEAAIREAFPRGGYLLLANNFMMNPQSHGYRLLFSNRELVYAHPEERFFIYEPIARANSPE